jgi:hypothetical protein
MRYLAAVVFTIAGAIAQTSPMTPYQRQLKIDVTEVFKNNFTDPFRCAPVACGTTDGTGHFFGYTSSRDGLAQEHTLQACLGRSSLGAEAASAICQQSLVCTELPELNRVRCPEYLEDATLHLAYDSKLRRNPRTVRLTGNQGLLHSPQMERLDPTQRSAALARALAPARRDLLVVFAETLDYATQCGQVSCVTSNGEGTWFAANDWDGDSAESVVAYCVEEGFKKPADIAGLISTEEKESLCRLSMVCTQPRVAPRTDCTIRSHLTKSNFPVSAYR